MNFARARWGRRRTIVFAAVGTGALAAGLATGGAFGAAPTTAKFDVVDYAFSLQGGGGNSTAVALGGKVDFAYPTGDDEHNVRFTRAGVACTQTDGTGGATNSPAVPTTPEEAGWAGECTFTQPGVYSFICDVPEHDMKGTITVVDETPPPTTTTSPGGGGTPSPPATPGTPPASGGGATTVPPAPKASIPAAPKITVAKRQKGAVVRGTISAKGSGGSRVAIDVRAKRVRVGKATRKLSRDGKLAFAITVDKQARATLKRAGRLALDVRVTVTQPVIGAQTESYEVTLRPARPARAAIAAKAPAKASVTLKNTRFAPGRVTIRKGGAVTWTWRDGPTPHDVVGSGFRSKIVTKGTFKHIFKKAGTFRYICSIHATMKGTVVVR